MSDRDDDRTGPWAGGTPPAKPLQIMERSG